MNIHLSDSIGNIMTGDSEHLLFDTQLAGVNVKYHSGILQTQRGRNSEEISSAVDTLIKGKEVARIINYYF